MPSAGTRIERASSATRRWSPSVTACASRSRAANSIVMSRAAPLGIARGALSLRRRAETRRRGAINVGSNHQGLRGGARRARHHRQEARGRRPAARGIAEAVRARRSALALLSRPSRRGRAAHRDPERAGRGQAGAARLRRRGLMEIADYIRERRAEVDATLATVLPRPPECPLPVADAMQYSLTAGGKRLRPILCLASADAVGGRREDALPAACAIELIHTYS